jgi:hypothetical protein
MSLFIEPGSASLRGDRLVSIQGRQQSDLCGIHVVSLPQEFRVPRDVAVVATIEGKLGWMEICHRKMVSNAAHKKSRNSIQSCSFQRGAARIRTGDGGFAIHCLSHLATAPSRVANNDLCVTFETNVPNVMSDLLSVVRNSSFLTSLIDSARSKTVVNPGVLASGAEC